VKVRSCNCKNQQPKEEARDKTVGSYKNVGRGTKKPSNNYSHTEDAKHQATTTNN